MDYQRRVLDDLLDELFPHMAAIALEGAKGVGKTAMAMQRAKTVFSLEVPQQHEILTADPDRVAETEPPTLIDEWQLEPSVWESVRRAVDTDPTGGRFLLAGSAGVAPGARIHTGAGRIVTFPMRPLAWCERHPGLDTVSLTSLLRHGGSPVVDGRSPFTLPDYIDETLRSGFPGIRGLPERARSIQLDSYLTRIVERELPENGLAVRRPSTLLAWLSAYAAATATDATYTALLDAATAGESDKPARQTVAAYRDHLQRIFILDPLPAWSPTFTPLKRLTLAPKHHLVDPALAARLVGIESAGLLEGQGTRVARRTGTWAGALFESLVTQSVRVCAQAAHARVGHLRTKNSEHEVDLIVEAEDRRVLPIEVKLANTVTDRDVRHLHWLHDQIGARVVDKLIINTGEYAYRRPDGVAVVPLALLGP